MSIFYDKFVHLCKMQGLTLSEACTLAGMHRSTYGSWRDGHAPTKVSVQKLATVFHVKPEYLMDDEAPVSEAEAAIIPCTEGLTPGEVEIAMWLRTVPVDIRKQMLQLMKAPPSIIAAVGQ